MGAEGKIQVGELSKTMGGGGPMNRKRTHQVKGVSLDQLQKDGPIIINISSVTNQISCLQVGSVNGTCAFKLACFNSAQRYAVVNGQQTVHP